MKDWFILREKFHMPGLGGMDNGTVCPRVWEQVFFPTGIYERGKRGDPLCAQRDGS